MENITDSTTKSTPTPRPFGFWLRAVDHLLAREFETALEAEGATRRDWRLLTLLSGDTLAPGLAERLQRVGGKKLRGLVEHGWIVESDGAWTLTDEGRAAQQRLSEAAVGIRAKVSGAVSDEDFAVTQATLETIARELGGNPDEWMPRGFGRHGFGPDFGQGRRGFGPGSGFGPGHGFGPRDAHRSQMHGEMHGEMHGAGERCHREGAEHRGRGRMGHGDAPMSHGGHGGHGGHSQPAGGRRAAQDAFERGFDAGFGRGAASRDA